MTASRKPMRTLRLRIRSEAYPWLRVAAMECNTVWNFANETAEKAIMRTDRNRKWLSGFDLCALTAGATEVFERIGAGTIERVCNEYGAKRSAVKHRRLRWRKSLGARRSLGWVPFRAYSLKRQGASIRFCGKQFRVFEPCLLEGVKFRDGCFAEDACGDWWLCVPVEVAITDAPAPLASVGIDLGCKDAAVTSEGDRLASGHYRRMEAKIAQAQRRGHKRQAKRLNRKATRQRQDAQHKFSTMLVSKYQQIFIGDVSSTKLVKTRMAKSVLDASWASLRNQLQYKGQQAGRVVEVVNESYTTRACSSCGALTGPTGLDMLSVRAWTCGECGDSHDRDVNAARNILARGKALPSVCGNEPQPIGLRHGRRRKPLQVVL
jgi:putative transposase